MAASIQTVPASEAAVVDRDDAAGPNALAQAGFPADQPGWPRRAWRTATSAGQWLLGLAAIVLALSLASSMPLVQFLVLGYLLEASARIVRSGRLSAGFVGVRQAATVGGMVLGCWLVLLPVRVIESLATSAQLVDPGGSTARRWMIAWSVVTVLAILHLAGALVRGGKLRHFLWPRPACTLRLLLRRGALAGARDAGWNFVVGMRLPYFFWLGVRGFVGGLVWIFVPVALIGASERAPPLAMLGSLLLALVVLYVPFAQTRFAAENRFRACFELAPLRGWFRRAPLAMFLALTVLLALALPLHLFKIEMLPRDAAWLPGVFFVAFALPSRLAVGWACAYAQRRPQMRHWSLRLAARLAMLSVALAYVLFVFFTQFTSWYGLASLYEQHAFLLPAPFLKY